MSPRDNCSLQLISKMRFKHKLEAGEEIRYVSICDPDKGTLGTCLESTRSSMEDRVARAV